MLKNLVEFPIVQQGNAHKFMLIKIYTNELRNVVLNMVDGLTKLLINVDYIYLI